MGCDHRTLSTQHGNLCFNSRTPCGVRPPVRSQVRLNSGFQFTHPVWGATRGWCRALASSSRFNSRTPCGVRLLNGARRGMSLKFQFTHPVWGATASDFAFSSLSKVFQFTHPVWGATASGSTSHWRRCSFNSRTPCGVRHRERTRHSKRPSVSIHAPRVGCDFS